MLGLGVWLSHRRDRRGEPNARRPAIMASLAAVIYTGLMIYGSAAAERIAAREIAARGLGVAQVVMANPVPFDPLRRVIVFRIGDSYGFGELRWGPMPQLTLEEGLTPRRMDDPAVARAAAQNKKVADFIYWSQLPFAEIERVPGEARVTLGDARYNRQPGQGHFVVRATVKE